MHKNLEYYFIELRQSCLTVLILMLHLVTLSSPDSSPKVSRIIWSYLCKIQISFFQFQYFLIRILFFNVLVILMILILLNQIFFQGINCGLQSIAFQGLKVNFRGGVI